MNLSWVLTESLASWGPSIMYSGEGKISLVNDGLLGFKSKWISKEKEEEIGQYLRTAESLHFLVIWTCSLWKLWKVWKLVNKVSKETINIYFLPEVNRIWSHSFQKYMWFWKAQYVSGPLCWTVLIFSRRIFLCERRMAAKSVS